MERVKLCHFEIAICRLQLGKWYVMFLVELHQNVHQYTPIVHAIAISLGQKWHKT
jgi:hypothetical protein